MNSPMLRHQKSASVVTKRVGSVRDDVMFSQRTHATLFVLPPGHTIVNKYPTIGRNRRVSVNGAPAMKFKHTPLYRQPRKIEVIK